MGVCEPSTRLEGIHCVGEVNLSGVRIFDTISILDPRKSKKEDFSTKELDS